MKISLLVTLAFLVFSSMAQAQEDLIPDNQMIDADLHENEAIQGKTYYDLKDFKCQGNKDECYDQIRLQMLASNVSVDGKVLQGLSAHKDGYSMYQLNTKRTKNVFVFIHGLWMDSGQYFGISKDIKIKEILGHQDPANMILLTLPGHRSHFKGIKERDKKISKKANLTDWVTAVDETVLLASQLGDNVIIVGQSTGGLLALMAAHRIPSLVKGLILTEPALKVKGLLKTASCDLSGVLSVFNSIVGKPVDGKLSLGCQVSQLGKLFLKDFAGETLDERVKSLAQSIQVPVLLLNNEEDDVVEQEVNRLFYDHLNVKKEYVSLTELKKGIDHGAAEVDLKDQLAEKIIQFGK